MFEVDISAVSPARFRSVLLAARYEAVSAVAGDPEGLRVLREAIGL